MQMRGKVIEVDENKRFFKINSEGAICIAKIIDNKIPEVEDIIVGDFFCTTDAPFFNETQAVIFKVGVEKVVLGN